MIRVLMIEVKYISEFLSIQIPVTPLLALFEWIRKDFEL